MIDNGTTRKTPHLTLILSAIILLTQAFPLWSADSRRFATVPALGVLAGGQTGIIHFIVLQIDKDPRQEGPIVNSMRLTWRRINRQRGLERRPQQAVAAATKRWERRKKVGDHDQEPVIQ